MVIPTRNKCHSHRVVEQQKERKCAIELNKPRYVTTFFNHLLHSRSDSPHVYMCRISRPRLTSHVIRQFFCHKLNAPSAMTMTTILTWKPSSTPYTICFLRFLLVSGNFTAAACQSSDAKMKKKNYKWRSNGCVAISISQVSCPLRLLWWRLNASNCGDSSIAASAACFGLMPTARPRLFVNV